MATEAEYWKARCVLELVFGLHPLIDVNSDGFRESIRDIRTRLRDGDFDPDLYTIAYEELGVD